MSDTIQGLWVGPRLSTMEQLSIRSYLVNGHEFHLYLYGPCENVPEGTTVKDGNEIVPESDIKRFRNLPNFSDWFRWNLLLKKGDWWVDLDTVCLRPLDMPGKYVFSDGDCAKGKNRVGAGNVKAPKGSPLVRWCVKSIERMDIESVTDFSGFGPTLLAVGINKFGLHRYIWPTWAFLPVAGWETHKFTTENIPLPPDAYVVHLYDNIWKALGYDKDGAYPPGSLYERLKRRVFDGDTGTLTFTQPRKNILVAVVTCGQNRAKAEAQYDTWVPRMQAAGYDVVFFDGENLGVADSPYIPAITEKAQAIYQWVWDRGYKGLLKCDDDCHIDAAAFEPPDADYAGIPVGPNDGGRLAFGFPDYPEGTHPHKFASGGAAWFSRKAIGILLEHVPIVGDWADDRWAGQVLGRAGIPVTPQPDFCWDPFYMPSKEHAVTTQLPSADAIRSMHDFGRVFPLVKRRVEPALIAIATCHGKEYALRHHKQLESWVPQAVAAGYVVEVFDGPRLGVPDDYGHLVEKTRAICGWAREHGHTRMLKVDDDTWVNVPQLIVPAADYAGYRFGAGDFGSERAGTPDMPPGTNPASYAMGGGYWLSEDAMRALAEAPLTADWAEDRWVGNTLARVGIELTDLPGYKRFSQRSSAQSAVRGASARARMASSDSQ